MEQKKSRHSTLSNSYEGSGLNDVDILAKVISLQCSWIKRLYNKNFHEWKIIPSYLIKAIFCKNLKFHPCLETSIMSLENVPKFYKDMITNWAKYLSRYPYLP